MNVTLSELLMVIQEADQVLLAIHDMDGLKRGYVRTSKHEIKRAFLAEVEPMKVLYEISWRGKTLLIE